MENTRNHGLAGKARRAREFNRITRMYAQQMIDEYLNPEPETWRPERYIPVRSRNEFLPSAAFIDDEQADCSQRQLELPLTTAAASLKPSTVAKVTDPARRDSVIRTPRSPFKIRQERDRKQSPFTPGGFLFGCALGSAAAAMVLLVVQLAVG